MAPPSMAQPKPRSASGHTKKQHSAPMPAAVAPANRQHVVPAIPLAYMNKQSNGARNAGTRPPAKHTPTASTSSTGFPAPSLEAALVSRNTLHLAKNSENEIKSEHMQKPAPVVAPPAGTGQQPQLSPVEVNGVGHANAKSNAGASYGAEGTRGANGDPSYTSQPQSATSTTKPEFAPLFPATSHPLQHGQHMVDRHPHPAAFRAPPPHHIHQHQHSHQMSNSGGIMFGGFDSHTPSPAPHLAAFMPPPPPHPHINGENRGHPPPNGHHHTHSNGNGFPPPINTHFQGDVMSVPSINGYGGRTVLAPTPPGHFEAHPPSAGRYGPPTPHSFHGSHTSGEPNGVENVALPYPQPQNGSFGPHRPPPGGPFPLFMPPQGASRFNMVEDDVMEGVRYIRSLFDNTELADCVLELVSAKGYHHPIKISGHKLILARSPALKQHVLTARANDRGSHTITMEIDDSYLRSDGWWMAVQRLYQYPLLRHPTMIDNGHNGINFAGNQVDRFKFCLGYAAAGHILAMPDVLIRGLEIAANSLTWDTIEFSLGFVLENTVQRHFDHRAEQEEALPPTFLEFGYGPETKILLSAILNFLITEFPAHFELDTSVLDPPKITRIPIDAATTTAPTRAHAADRVIPAIARGTTIRQLPKQTRLSSIKFGDLPAAYPDDGASPSHEPAKHSPTLSRILLNLPFDDLCQVLTSGGNGVSAWNTAQDRCHAIVDVVVEREARRLRAVEAVRSEAVPNAREIQSRLSTPHRHTIAEPWDVLNWEEEVIRDERPRIVRRWVPQFDVAQQPTQQRAPPSYDGPDDSPDSMV
ncbi:hypothetical protein F4803DRAFT_411146 [Xylaria telfairii]|nr:hypothetical protein F4803DRAFT_411146 [Xylaria telfairii]